MSNYNYPKYMVGDIVKLKKYDTILYTVVKIVVSASGTHYILNRNGDECEHTEEEIKCKMVEYSGPL